MRKIKASGKTTRIPMSLSNYMPGCDKGTEVAKRTFIEVINSQPMDPAAICKVLNAHKWVCDTFKPYRPLINGISLIATDCWGNQDIITITED